MYITVELDLTHNKTRQQALNANKTNRNKI